VERSKFTFSNTRGRRLLSTAVAFALVAGVLAGGAQAQRFVDPVPPTNPIPPLPGGVTGIGGGAGLTPALPQLPPAYSPPPPAVMPMPTPAPASPARGAATPAMPAKAVRFRCDLAPAAQTCKEVGKPDSGDGDSNCDCAHDYCHDEAGPEPGQSHRVCDKLQ
jgi:hypothetical protein